MADRPLTRAFFLSVEEEVKSLPAGEVDRLYFGHEFCHWRFPGRRQVERLRRAAAERGLTFTLVTPAVNEQGLTRIMKVLEGFDPAPGDEVTVNDVGLLERLSETKWSGRIVLGRLLTRQQRGAGWKGDLPAEEGAARVLRGSSLDSPSWVDWFYRRYGVERFEIDNLVQGVEVGELPASIRLSVYTPWLFLTATTLCPWTFDGRRWGRTEGCAAPCTAETLELTPEGGGRTILMGGGIQFLENDGDEIYTGPAVDRHVFQPRIPA